MIIDDNLKEYLLDIRFKNMEGEIRSLEMAFIDYVETAPKSSQQWMEERIRVLELQVKELMERQVPGKYND